MRGIIDEAATNKTDDEVDKYNRQHAGAKCPLKTFRKFTAKLDTENEENANQAEQRA